MHAPVADKARRMRIGELSQRVGITVEALRFYERAGVLGAVDRDRSGYRVYSEQTYRTLVVVRWAQGLGLRLEDMAGFLGAVPPEGTADERLDTFTRMVDERLSTLRDELARLERSICDLEALRSVPFQGECVMPASFVDRLVTEHEQRSRGGFSP